MAPSPARNAPLVLIVRDGWGDNPHHEHDDFNAVKLAHTPVADRLAARWPTTLIRTCGEDVGLPAQTMGNSEVGHQNIGAGRVVDQEVLRITRTLGDGSFFENDALRKAFAHALGTGGNVHLLGLVSDGLVHSDLDHLFGLIELAVREKFPPKRLFVHAITDGRDTGPRTGRGFIEAVEAKLAATGVGRIATVIGRYYAMDRDRRWDRVALAYDCLTGYEATRHSPETQGLSVRTASSALDAIQSYYDQPTESNRSGDEFIVPTRIATADGSQPLATVRGGDAVIFFNFRGDRPRELTKAFVLDDNDWDQLLGAGDGFERGEKLGDLYFCAMTEYEKGLPVTAIAFRKPPKLDNMLGEIVSLAGLTQFRCAETEKYPHVTFFFNDYREEPFAGEHRLLIPSPKDVSTYDQKPQMSAHEVCAAVLDRLKADDCESLIIVNIANADMVGHTGNLQAATRAVEVVDECVGQIVEGTLNRQGSLVVTADHGNAEQMFNPHQDCPHTAHTTYDVFLSVIGDSFTGRRLRPGGRLADIAPTILDMLGLDTPPEMTGKSLLQ